MKKVFSFLVPVFTFFGAGAKSSEVLSTSAVGIAATETVQAIPAQDVIHIVTQIVIGIVTLIRLLKANKSNEEQKSEK